ncbi:hypothetical protein LOTGIDRAFT_238318 [Lottia gigantea]|uniref:Uncharacterized protein n=1 Tax=Lottia gigantea TaxID=225164 RepID=V4B5C8_LOTGI|nr:hypothetical protein LOTGIDRAFT_238318 [Lottia gigantea]ESP01197.1 hypothetical protein LOTGIDRAFT_238318 [Lottia gigantea]
MSSLFLIAAIVVCSAYGDGVGSQLLKSLRICPIVECAFIACLDDMSTHTQTFHFNGMNCPGCPTCARPRPIDIKRALNPLNVGSLIHLDMCPMTMCAQLVDCSSDQAVMGYFDFHVYKASNP